MIFWKCSDRLRDVICSNNTTRLAAHVITPPQEFGCQEEEKEMDEEEKDDSYDVTSNPVRLQWEEFYYFTHFD